MLEFFKKMFFKEETNDTNLTTSGEQLTALEDRPTGSEDRLTVSEEDNDKSIDEFTKTYNEAAEKLDNVEDFNRFAIKVILTRIKKTEYAKHHEFVHEIKYFMYYLLKVIKDDYSHGDKICLKTLTQFDNYIFSAYSKMPELEENIRKFTKLADSKRFTENPKENILSYFVFLEENGIGIIELLQDYTDILSKKKTKPGICLQKHYEKKKNESHIEQATKSFQSFPSIAPSMQNNLFNPKNLDEIE